MRATFNTVNANPDTVRHCHWLPVNTVKALNYYLGSVAVLIAPNFYSWCHALRHPKIDGINGGIAIF